MDEIEGLAKGARCKKFKTVKGVRRCASFTKPRKSTKKASRKSTRGRRPANKGKVCVRYKSVDGVRRCAKFGTKSAAKKTTKRSTKKKASRSKAKKPAKRRRASGAKATIEVPRRMGLTFGGKLRKGCRSKPGAKGKLLCTPEAVARMSIGGDNVRRSAPAGRSTSNTRSTGSRWGANVR